MEPSTIKPPIIEPVPSAERRAALELLMRDLDPLSRRNQVDRCLELLAANPAAAAGLLQASAGNRRVGVLWAQPLPGRVTTLWSPQFDLSDDIDFESCGHKLLNGSLQHAAAVSSRLVQALIAPDEQNWAALLFAAGFFRAAELLYLVFPVEPNGSFGDRLPDGDGASDLVFEPAPVATTPRLAGLLESTYQSTRDCPALNGLRETPDVLATYAFGSAASRNLWFIVRRAQQDVGCLFLTEFTASRQWELVYMGVVPAARGQGLGREIARRAQRVAAQEDGTALVLAVDAENAPALNAYLSLGGAVFDRKEAWLKVLESTREKSPPLAPVA